MRRRWLRLLFLVFLLLAGSYALVYGLFFHRAILEETKQREVTIGVSTLGDSGESSPESGNAQAAPPDKTPPESGPASEDVDPFRSPPADGGPAASSGNPFESPPPHGLPNIPGVRLKKITEDYVELVEDSEPAIVRDVTVGGIMLLPNGHLKRTYSGKPPALCPT